MNVSKQNQPMRAEDILRKSVAFLEQQAEAYLKQSQFEDARKAAEQLLKIQPKHAPGYKLIGDVLLRQGQLEEAQRYYTQTLQLQPNWAEVQANLGSIHAQSPTVATGSRMLSKSDHNQARFCRSLSECSTSLDTTQSTAKS